VKKKKFKKNFTWRFRSSRLVGKGELVQGIKRKAEEGKKKEMRGAPVGKRET